MRADEGTELYFPGLYLHRGGPAMGESKIKKKGRDMAAREIMCDSAYAYRARCLKHDATGKRRVHGDMPKMGLA